MTLAMLLTKKELLLTQFWAAQEAKKKFFAIRVKMEGFPSDEIIINDSDNINDKIKYWDKTYNDDLIHKYSPTISIVSWFAADTYEEIQKILAQ